MGGWGLEDMLGRRNSTRQKKADRGLVIVLPYQKKNIYIYISLLMRKTQRPKMRSS